MSKKTSKKEDTISQLKKEENKLNKNSKKEEDESDQEEEEEEQYQDEIKEQTVQHSDRPKSLKELMNSIEDSKPKPKQKKPQPKQNKKNNEEPKKLTFINSKGTGNADKIDREPKKVFKNAKGLDKAAKDNQKIKPTRNYTEKDVEKEYQEDIAKPQFITNKDKDENFVELNKNEDVSILCNNLLNYLVIREKFGK